MHPQAVSNHYRYWGKASPTVREPFHLLVFHSLDVAACGRCLIRLPRFSLKPLADELGWQLEQVEALCVFFLALHDLGKFASAFQSLVPDLSPDLVAPVKGKHYSQRHDTLGWLLWQNLLEDFPVASLPDAGHECWAIWMRSTAGHHGRPPLESTGGGLVPLISSDYFTPEDRLAARGYVAEVASWLLPPDGLPVPSRVALKVLCRHSWRLAGLAVLADWLGSNQSFFPYRSTPVDELRTYWDTCQPFAEQALQQAGLQCRSARSWPQPCALFDYLHEPTPLQQYAASVELEPGPQLFLLEDVTGAGKTEAALILTQRLMQACLVHGLYFALPSMATANQMYQRVGQVYQRLYAGDETSPPSLVLAHGARMLVDGFRQSIVQSGESPTDHDYTGEDRTASAQCNAWLADNRKKALLADVGVGTLDQALLAVMPARHQSLRLLGLAGKVLLVDEVHAYDPYMLSLLKRLLTAHARQGGSVILLSATLPVTMREELLAAYRFGLGVDDASTLDDLRYPLAVQAGRAITAHACATRPQVKRRVEIRAVYEEAEVLALLVEQANAGRCTCWIRNTVDDARRAYQLLSESLPRERVTLFHSRYAMGHRLDIEDDVLSRFGKHSNASMRAGRILIGTQVLEQSLDFDVDLMVSDLAPVDLLIQRAGRLQRHARDARGDPAADGCEHRTAPMLYVLTAELVDAPGANWYASLFPKACYVYPDAGKLWLGARALLAAGCLVSPGEPEQPGAVRALVEAVYGEGVDEIPEALQRASRDQLGKGLAMQSQAGFNALNLDKGYCEDSSARWFEEHSIPTRLGDETLTLYLAREAGGELRPLCDTENHPWEQSALRIRAGRAQALAPHWQQRFAAQLMRLRQHYRLLEEPAFILPLVEEAGQLRAYVQDDKGRELEMRYDQQEGLVW